MCVQGQLARRGGGRKVHCVPHRRRRQPGARHPRGGAVPQDEPPQRGAVLLLDGADRWVGGWRWPVVQGCRGAGMWGRGCCDRKLRCGSVGLCRLRRRLPPLLRRLPAENEGQQCRTPSTRSGLASPADQSFTGGRQRVLRHLAGAGSGSRSRRASLDVLRPGSARRGLDQRFSCAAVGPSGGGGWRRRRRLAAAAAGCGRCRHSWPVRLPLPPVAFFLPALPA